MRIYIRLSKSDNLLPFNYQELLTGVLHKWIGENNEVHGKPNQYSFSWIENTVAQQEGLKLKNDAFFFISSHDDLLIKRIIKGIIKNPEMFFDIQVVDVQIQNIPEFNSVQEFLLGSPVLLKTKENNRTKHITIVDESFEEVLTQSFINKLKKAQINSDGVRVRINPTSTYRQTKLVTYKGINNKTSLVPIIIEGNQEQIAYAWCNGLGNSTGIGFGSLK